MVRLHPFSRLKLLGRNGLTRCALEIELIKEGMRKHKGSVPAYHPAVQGSKLTAGKKKSFYNDSSFLNGSFPKVLRITMTWKMRKYFIFYQIKGIAALYLYCPFLLISTKILKGISLLVSNVIESTISFETSNIDLPNLLRL